MANNNNTLLNAWGGFGDDQGMYEAFEPYLNIAKRCESQAPEGNCFNSSYTNLNSAVINMAELNTDYSVILSNGASLAFYSNEGAIANNNWNYIWIDTNGKKGPNTIGKDFHKIVLLISSDPIKPVAWFMPNSSIILSCPDDLNSSVGDLCGSRILRGDYGEDY